MRALVHIGPPKTGTTSLQSFLQLNRAELAKRSVRYEHWDHSTSSSQYELAIMAHAENEEVLPSRLTRRSTGLNTVEKTKILADEYQDWLQSQVAVWSEDLCVFSSEHIFDWIRTKHQMATLDRILSRYFDRVDYVIYIRRQEDQILSRYSQSMRSGSTNTLEQHVEKWIDESYAERIMNWVDVVGVQHFQVRLLDKEHLKDGDLYKDFLSLLGCERFDFQEPDRANEAISAPALEILRQFNGRFPYFGTKGRNQNPARRKLAQWLTQQSDGQRKLRMPPDLVQRIRDHHAEGNEWIRKTFWPDLEELFLAKPEHPAPDYHPVTVEEVCDIYAELLLQSRTGAFPAIPIKQRKNIKDLRRS